VKANGFTLVELLVALLIFGMLSAAGVGLLSFSVRAQEASETSFRQVSALRSAGALIAADVAQAAPRLWRDEEGRTHPAFSGGNGAGGEAMLTLVRRGWENHDGATRASLQRVEYRLEQGLLMRQAWRHVDGGAPMPALPLLEGVQRVALRYRDAAGVWRERWDPELATALPSAVEVQADLAGYGTVRQLFLAGGVQ
jgi:general secretion pathway protein J